MSARYVDIKDKASRLVDEAGRVGLKINAKKSTVMQTNARKDQRIKVNDNQVDDVKEFLYLGALLDKGGGKQLKSGKKVGRGIIPLEAIYVNPNNRAEMLGTLSPMI